MPTLLAVDIYVIVDFTRRKVNQKKGAGAAVVLDVGLAKVLHTYLYCVCVRIRNPLPPDLPRTPTSTEYTLADH